MQGRRQHDEGRRHAVDAELVLDAEEGDPVDASTKWKPAPTRRQVADEQEQRDDPGREGHRERRPVGPDGLGRIATTSAPTSGRNVMIVRIGMSARSSRLAETGTSPP